MRPAERSLRSVRALEPFEWSADRATVPADAGMCADKPTTLDLEPKYMFESDNGYNDETFVILHAGGDYKSITKSS